jgi:hypothetical protein
MQSHAHLMFRFSEALEIGIQSAGNYCDDLKNY